MTPRKSHWHKWSRCLVVALERAWYAPSLPWWLYMLIPFSWVYAGIVVMRRLSYAILLRDAPPPPMPVIVVGSLLVGGVGKTPVVIALVASLRRLGYTPGVISRGYGGSITGVQSVTGDSMPDRVGDEPVLIARRATCPVVVGRDRVKALQHLCTHHACDIAISDDGLQHVSLRGTINLVLFDAVRGLGNGHCLPAGPLREPLHQGVPIDFLVCSGESLEDPLTPQHPDLKRLKQPCYGVKRSFGSVYAIKTPTHCLHAKETESKPLYAVAGIAHPERFFAQLKKMGYHPRECYVYLDHHSFVAPDIDLPGYVIMTEKDAIKCRDFADARHYCLPVTCELPHVLVDMLVARLLK